jgi:hypothetical protein
MTEQHTPQRERQSLLTDIRTGFLAWRTRDILIIAAVGLVFGLLLIGATYGAIVTVAFGSAFQWFWNSGLLRQYLSLTFYADREPFF